MRRKTSVINGAGATLGEGLVPQGQEPRAETSLKPEDTVRSANSPLEITRAHTSKPFQHHRVWANGVCIHCVTAGEGRAVILLHGWPQCWFAWRKVIAALSVHYFVIALDMRGFADSSKPFSGFDKKSVATDIHEVAKSFGLTTAFIVGHDIGGQVAYAYAAQWPIEVSGVAFIECGLPAFGQEQAMDVSKGGSWHFGFNMAGDISEALVQDRERTLY